MELLLTNGVEWYAEEKSLYTDQVARIGAPMESMWIYIDIGKFTKEPPGI